MPENTTAKALKIIGAVIIIGGIIACIVIGCQTEGMAPFMTGGIIGSVVLGSLLIGIGEIISLLDRSAADQSAIRRRLDDLVMKNSPAPGPVDKIRKDISPEDLVIPSRDALGDQEAGSPDEDTFRCVNCGTMIEGFPCKCCGYKPRK